jgi:ABC-type Zn uptake system ZnuABC Zn-binding protein ZnuA
MKRRPLLLALLAGLLAAAAGRLPAAEPARLRVLTTVPPIHAAAASVAGGLADVEPWLPAGGDPHDFQFTARDLRRLRDADLLVVNGLGLESWLQRALARAGATERLRVVEAAAGLPAPALIRSACADDGHDHGDGHGHEHPVNPHIWPDPVLMMTVATNLVQAFAAADPANRAGYERNGAAFVARLHALDGEFRARLAPVRDRPFLSHHDAHPYLVRRYHLRQLGVIEQGAGVEPSARHLAALAATARAEGVRVLFIEPGPPRRLAARFAQDAGLRLAVLDPLESGAATADGYEAAMRRNLDALVAALQAPAP